MNSVRKAVARRAGWERDLQEPTLAPSQLSRSRAAPAKVAFVQQWILDHTTPSSNTRNVVKYTDPEGNELNHVIHWRTETISTMYLRCKLEYAVKEHDVFSRSFFLKQIPSFVKCRKKQDGLCPIHYTGILLEKELVNKRRYWHQNCTCSCVFCSSTGCNHGNNPLGGKCSQFSCERCKATKCRQEWNFADTNWCRPIQVNILL